MRTATMEEDRPRRPVRGPEDAVIETDPAGPGERASRERSAHGARSARGPLRREGWPTRSEDREAGMAAPSEDRHAGVATRSEDREAGMATAEYAIATVAAAGFAGLLIAILRSDEVRGLLLGIVRGALAV